MEFHLFEIFFFPYDKIQTQQNNQNNALAYILPGFDISDSLINKAFGKKSPLIKTSAWRRAVSFVISELSRVELRSMGEVTENLIINIIRNRFLTIRVAPRMVTF